MHPPEIVVFDQLSPCPYLDGEIARLPHRQPLQMLNQRQFDERLAEGDRRSGNMLYRPGCPHCRACEPIRLNLQTFKPNESQRRAYRRGEELLETRVGEPEIDAERIRLFNLHRELRGLDRGDEAIDELGYLQFLVDSCCQTWELSYWYEGRLAGVAITDVGRKSLSAVYCYFDPTIEAVSIGTYSVLRQVELCREQHRQYLYLGFYVAGSQHMEYKAKYHPHERRVNGKWTHFA